MGWWKWEAVGHVPMVVGAGARRGILTKLRCVLPARMDCVMDDPEDWYPELEDEDEDDDA